MWLEYSCFTDIGNIIDRLIVSGGGGARSHLSSLHQHGGGETGGAGDFSAKVTTGPRSAERQGWPGGDANTEVCYFNVVIDQELKQLHINSSSSFCCSNNRCAELSKELANQKDEFCQQVTCVREELESEAGALQRRLEGLERERDGRETQHDFNSDRNTCFLTVFLCVSALLQLGSEKEKRIEEMFREAEEKENRQVEIQGSRVKSRRGERRQQQELGESQLVQTFQEGAKVSLNWPISYWPKLVICPLNVYLCSQRRGGREETPVSSPTSSKPDGKKVPKTTGRKRKNCQLEVCVRV